jgi:triosephosphate isomerase
LSLEEIEKCIKIAKEYDLTTVCCSADVNKSKEIAKFAPDFIAYEDPTLIGTGQPISKMKPETIKEFVEILANINSNIIPLCGAGISTGEDVKIALELGCKGVLVASAIVKAQKPKVVLEDMTKAIK